MKILSICNRCGNKEYVEVIGGLEKCFKCGETDIGYQEEKTFEEELDEESGESGEYTMDQQLREEAQVGII